MPIGGDDAEGVGGPIGIGIGIGIVMADGSMSCPTASGARSWEASLDMKSSPEAEPDIPGCAREPLLTDCAEGGGEMGRDHIPSPDGFVCALGPVMPCDNDYPRWSGQGTDHCVSDVSGPRSGMVEEA